MSTVDPRYTKLIRPVGFSCLRIFAHYETRLKLRDVILRNSFLEGRCQAALSTFSFRILTIFSLNGADISLKPVSYSELLGQQGFLS